VAPWQAVRHSNAIECLNLRSGVPLAANGSAQCRLLCDSEPECGADPLVRAGSPGPAVANGINVRPEAKKADERVGGPRGPPQGGSAPRLL
jgi:hypothetical protein